MKDFLCNYLVLPRALLHQPMLKGILRHRGTQFVLLKKLIFFHLSVDFYLQLKVNKVASGCIKTRTETCLIQVVRPGGFTFGQSAPAFGFELNAKNYRAALECRHSPIYSPFNWCH